MRNALLLIGKDVVSHHVARSLLTISESLGVQIHLAMTPSPTSSLTSRPEVVQFLRQERRAGLEKRVADLARIYGPDFHDTIDVNSNKARQWIDTLKPLAVINFRGFQKFGRRTITHLNDGAIPLVNVHPALLPNYRGLFSTLHAMAAGESLIGCTLHQIDANYDTGPILATKSIQANYKISVLANLRRLHGPALDLITDFLDRIQSGKSLDQGVSQRGQGDYFGFPDTDCLNRLHQRGVALVNQELP